MLGPAPFLSGSIAGRIRALAVDVLALAARALALEEPEYVDSTGTPGNATVAATVRCGLVAPTTTNVVVTHPAVTADSVILVAHRSPTAARRVSVVPGAGSFTIYISGYTGGEPALNWSITRF